MGDILFRQDATLKIGIIIAGPTTYEFTVAVRQGTWFAHALAFWQYLINVWNNGMYLTWTTYGTMAVSLDTDPDSANYLKVMITPDSGWGVLTSTYFEVPGVYADLGLASTPYDMGAVTVPTSVGTLPYVLAPVWPPVTYERGVSNLSGASGRSHDGTVYSTVGAFQETVNLVLALDRREQRYDEVTDFITLWRERWCRGRSVSFYLDRETMPTVTQPTIGSGDVLVLVSNQDKIDFTRTIAYKEFQDKMADIVFGIKTPTPATAEGQSYYIL